MEPYRLRQTSQQVQQDLDKIEALGPATSTREGTMSSFDKRKLDALGIQYNTTAYWDSRIGYVPKAGEIIIYSDYKSVTEGGVTKYLPGIKIGSGNAYVQDLVFATSSDTEMLLDHINNSIRHITAEERASWNNKLGLDTAEVINETLLLTRG